MDVDGLLWSYKRDTAMRYDLYTIGLGTLVMPSRDEENTCHGVL
jgi:hypothetical protein